jgi:hypothetical protein
MVVEDQIRKRLMRLADICLSFPGSTREDESRHSTFRVGKKIFAYYLNDHDRDQIISVCCRVLEGDNLPRERFPDRERYTALRNCRESVPAKIAA